ncbi:histidine-rich glycoprotein-like [Ctenocephalides felis]|uniref:histidine-rich glycoprotein-like n=1 Tax=Ctenocephalides felis TaxID=7515 RepID=UPI000E6E49BD|nr:histidine-rich glycoprotein-like [Ctenocephalides felis]
MVLTICLYVSYCEAGHKKVVIHVPLKIKKLKHTHTIYKTIHHYHTIHGGKHEKNDADDGGSQYENQEEEEGEMAPSGEGGDEREEHIHHHHHHNETPMKHNRGMMHHHQGYKTEPRLPGYHHGMRGHQKSFRMEEGRRRFLEDSRQNPEFEDYPEQEIEDEEESMKKKREAKH